MDAILALAILTLLAVPLGRIWPPFDLVAQFLFQGVILAAVGAAVALAQARHGRAVLGVLLCVVGLAMVRPGATGLSAGAATGAELRVLVANLQRPTGTLPIADLEAVLDSSGADVVVLSEVAPTLLAALDRPDRRFAHVVSCRGERYCENAILAHRPLRSVAYHVDARGGGRALVAEVDVDGVAVAIAATHLLRPIRPGSLAQNWTQALFVAERSRTLPRLVLAGDLNGAPWARVVRHLERELGLRSTFLPGGTWPAWLPPGLRLHIDHVLAGCGVIPVTARSLAFPLSDHRAVLATLRVDPSAACEVSPPAASGR